MDSMFINKIVGAVLLVVLVGFAAAKLSNLIVGVHETDTVAFPVPEFEVAAAPGAEEEAPTPIAVVLANATIDRGERTFKSKCASCHSVDEGGENKIGPNLFGILDKDIASKDTYGKYSDTLLGLDGDWDYEKLGAFIRAPRDWAPGTSMGFAALKKESELGGVMLYLRSYGDADTPLPEVAEVEAETTEETEAPAPAAE